MAATAVSQKVCAPLIFRAQTITENFLKESFPGKFSNFHGKLESLFHYLSERENSENFPEIWKVLKLSNISGKTTKNLKFE